jgi:hypothetical protein
MMKTRLFFLSQCALLAISLGAGTLAHAQWGWTDKDGRRVFSDQAPPNSIPDKSIFKQPAGKGPVTITPIKEETAADKAIAEAAKAAGEATKAVAPKSAASSAADVATDKKKKELEAAVAAKKKADADKFAAAQATNCAEAKKSKASLSSGVRIGVTNDKGEREFMSDTERAARNKRVDDVIASECK